ncbi:MAG: hypothetical protein HC767_06230 [Akkermansiaceae bacterium]|nr:hypothetical protein [Akkermansiaceae bacterium]
MAKDKLYNAAANNIFRIQLGALQRPLLQTYDMLHPNHDLLSRNPWFRLIFRRESAS